jgi:hypothetical protein
VKAGPVDMWGTFEGSGCCWRVQGVGALGAAHPTDAALGAFARCSPCVLVQHTDHGMVSSLSCSFSGVS